MPDVRDGLKWGARKLLHAQYLGKLTYDKPFKKALKSVSLATNFSYTHGDMSAYSTFIRMAKPFSYRIPLQEAIGNYGTQMSPDDHSASRYVELRGSEAAYYIIRDLEKNTIKEWEDTYDMEGQFPKVFPSKGFWNGVNGCISIGSGMSCSMPPLNIKEVNEAMIKLLWNPNISDEEVICLPDFPTGATILNAEEVKESLKKGVGKACHIRATIDWDEKERCFIVKEMPYSTFTNTICNELADLLENNEKCGVKDFVDYTGEKPDLRIYLTKNANPSKILKWLLKETSLETYFTINMTVLGNGITPTIMGQKQMFQAHLNHEIEVYIRGFEFDLQKIKARLHILEGLVKALSIINEVIKTIKSCADTKAANIALQNLLKIDEAQAKAILDLKLSRLTHLDITKLEKEKNNLEIEKTNIETILSDETLLKKEIEKGLKEVAEKFGDARRTKVLNLAQNEDEVVEEKLLQISLSNQNNIYVNEASTLYTQKRGGVGNKLKMSKGEYIINSISLKNTEEVLFFSREGKVFSIAANQLEIGESSLESYFELGADTIVALSKIQKGSKTISFFTARGLIKKSSIEEYKTKKKTGLKAIELRDGDKIISVLEDCNEVGLYTKKGFFIHISIDDVRAIGRVAQGVIAMKVGADDEVIAAKSLDGARELIFINENGLMKRTKIEEFPLQGRAGKGKKAHENSADFYARKDEREITIISSSSSIKISLDEIPLSSRDAMGVKSIKLGNDKKVIALI